MRKDIEKGLRDLVACILLAKEMLDVAPPGSPERKLYIDDWLLEGKDYLFGSSPLDVCLRGDGHILVEFLRKKLGYKYE